MVADPGGGVGGGIPPPKNLAIWAPGLKWAPKIAKIMGPQYHYPPPIMKSDLRPWVRLWQLIMIKLLLDIGLHTVITIRYTNRH